MMRVKTLSYICGAVCGIFLGIIICVFLDYKNIFIYNLSCPNLPNITLDCPQPLVTTSCPEYNCPDCNCPQSYHIEKIYTSHFQEVINSVCNERDYELDVWDCSDESIEGVKRLKNAGYEGWYDICGYYYKNLEGNNKERHCWVTNGKMIIEFTTCEIIHPRDYWRYKK